MRMLARETGRLRDPGAKDYFVYRRGLFDGMPPFIVGRAVYDSWMIVHALRSCDQVVDATDVITAVHQDHPAGTAPVSTPLPIVSRPLTSNRCHLEGTSGSLRYIPPMETRRWASTGSLPA